MNYLALIVINFLVAVIVGPLVGGVMFGLHTGSPLWYRALIPSIFPFVFGAPIALAAATLFSIFSVLTIKLVRNRFMSYQIHFALFGILNGVLTGGVLSLSFAYLDVMNTYNLIHSGFIGAFFGALFNDINFFLLVVPSVVCGVVASFFNRGIVNTLMLNQGADRDSE